MPTHSKFAARKLAVEREILTPAFPADVAHLADGTWTCSRESVDALTRSFQRFGITLDGAWSFDTLYDNFTFILRAAGRLRAAGSGAPKEYSATMCDYLLAVKARDANLIATTLQAVQAEERSALPAAAEPARTPPRLSLVQ
jgi:hypothetical protein